MEVEKTPENEWKLFIYKRFSVLGVSGHTYLLKFT